VVNHCRGLFYALAGLHFFADRSDVLSRFRRGACPVRDRAVKSKCCIVAEAFPFLERMNGSLSRYRNAWAIQWVEGRARKTLYPGPMTKKQAGTVRTNLEALITAKKARTSIPDSTATWVAEIDPAMREKLYNAGLIEKPAEKVEKPVETLADCVNRYIATATAKESSKTVWKRCRRVLLTYFGGGRPIDSIGVGDAKDFRAWLLTEGRLNQAGEARGLSENTARKMCSVAAQFFADAMDREHIARNPFAHKDVPRTTVEERGRDAFVTRETAQAVMDACPDAEWRLIFALSRYGGLRCPSEHLAMRWTGVDWERGRMQVISPKTAHHKGKGSRMVPIFPELRPYLEDAWEPSAVFVINRYRQSNVNLRTQLERILAIAGIEPWPKLFHNLRASRETELAREFPLHIVCSWIGNSPVIAARHYLQVTDSDFDRACTAKSTVETGGS